MVSTIRLRRGGNIGAGTAYAERLECWKVQSEVAQTGVMLLSGLYSPANMALNIGAYALLSAIGQLRLVKIHNIKDCSTHSCYSFLQYTAPLGSSYSILRHSMGPGIAHQTFYVRKSCCCESGELDSSSDARIAFASRCPCSHGRWKSQKCKQSNHGLSLSMVLLLLLAPTLRSWKSIASTAFAIHYTHH